MCSQSESYDYGTLFDSGNADSVKTGMGASCFHHASAHLRHFWIGF